MTESREARDRELREMIDRVKAGKPQAGETIHTCQLAERFLDRLQMDAQCSESAPVDNPWRHVDERLPLDGELCLICQWNEGVVGPIVWKLESNMWLDLFATPEAGMCYEPHKPITHWKLSDLPESPSERDSQS